ncbi:MAG: pentapeptide repeat-containing protein [Tatlockia sp.]|nr:pentapeptide repeat-containing protein [Tatlockia sp.]
MQSKVDLLDLLKETTTEFIKMHQRLDLNLYVPLAGHCPNSLKEFVLEEGVDTWFQNERSKVLLLTGHSGSGKTSFGQMLIRKKWETCGMTNHHSSANKVFLWIPLLSIKKPEEKLIEKHLRYNLRLAKPVRDSILASNYSYFCVLDGYDELQTDENLFITNELNTLSKNGKIIFTCRDEILKADYRQRFMPSNPEEGFSEFRLLPLDELQKENYLLRYVKHNRTAWDLDTYKAKLDSIPQLNSLISNPFLLSITVKVLPEILQKHSQYNEAKRIELTRHDIYQVFMDKQFEERTIKLLKKDNTVKPLLENSSYVKKLIDSYATTDIKNLRPPCFIIETEQGPKGLSYVELFARFTERMARAMFKHHVTEITYKHGSVNQQSTSSFKTKMFNWQDGFLEVSHDSGLEILLKAAPLIPVGTNQHGFIHPSVLEFYAAQHLFDGALLYGWVLGDHNLNVSGLLDQPAVLKMLAERVHGRPEFEKSLWNIIKMSCSEPTVWRAAANAITILNRAGVSFSGKDLQHIRIGGIDGEKRWGADLSRGVMDGADFRNADLHYVNFTNAWFSNALFDGACMDGTDFGEQPWLDLRISSSALSNYISYEKGFYVSPDGKWLAKITKYGLREFRDMEEFYGAKVFDDVQLYRITESAVTLGQRITFDEVQKVVLSNEWIAVAGYKTLDLFNLISGNRVDSITFGRRWLQLGNIVFSNNGQYIAIPNKDLQGGIYISNINTSGKMSPAIFLPSVLGLVFSVVFSPDDQYVFEVNSNSDIAVWDISNKALPQKVFVYKQLAELTDSCGKICSDASGQKIALLYPYKICIYDWDKKEIFPLFSFPTSEEERGNAKFSLCGRWIAFFGQSTSDILLWNLSSRSLEYVLTGHRVPIQDISFVTINKLISYGGDGTIRSWSLNLDHLKNYKIVSNGKNVECITCNANGLWIGSSNESHIVELRETLSGKLLEVLEEPYVGITEIAFNPAKNEEIIYQSKRRLYRRNILTKEKQILPNPYRYAFHQFALDSTGEKLVSCYAEDPASFRGSHLCLWESSLNQKSKFISGVYTPHSYKKKIESFALHPHEDKVAMALFEKIRVANLNKSTLEIIGTLQADTDVRSLSFHPKEQYLAGIGKIDGDPQIYIWNIQSYELITKLNPVGYTKNEFESPAKVDFSPTGDYLASMIGTDNVYLWETARWTCVHIIKASYPGLKDFAWSKKIDESGILYLGIAYSSGLKMWKLDSRSSVLKLQLLWRTDTGLDCNSIHLKKTTGLSQANYKLLSQYSSNTIEGRPSDKSSLDIIKQRNQQNYIPGGKIDSLNKHRTIDKQNWCISLVREKKPGLEQSQDHSWLLIQGIDENNYTVNKELHFYLKTHAGSCLGLVGRGTVTVKDRSFWDLNYQVKNGNLISRTWHLTKATAMKLILEVGEQAARGYIFSGKTPTMFGASYLNCLSWCLEQLRTLDLPAIPPRGSNHQVISQFLGTLTDYIVVLPKRYLPEQNEEDNEYETSCTLF